MKCRLTLSDGAEICYRVDDFTDPWLEVENVLFVHGFGESSEAWRCYVPHFSRRRRVMRVDMRGFGDSTPMPEDFDWTLERWSQDLEELIEEVAPQGVHLVAAKAGGPVSIETTVRRPDVVRSLSLLGAIVQGADHTASIEHIRELGLRSWVAETMPSRLGANAPAVLAEWWTELMCRTPVSTALGFFQFVKTVNVRDRLPSIARPTQVIATDNLRRPMEGTREWQRRIPASTLSPVSGDAYHVAASEPDLCAELVSQYLDGIETG